MKKLLLTSSIIVISSLVVLADENIKTEISKYGNTYFLNTKTKTEQINCTVVYRKIGNKYNRVFRCCVWKDVVCMKRQQLKNTLKFPTEDWINLDTLAFEKYGEYALWHNSPESIVKDAKELAIAKSYYQSKNCNGKYEYDVVNDRSYCTETVDLTKDMTKQEKEDYFRAKDFEEDYENFIRYKRMYP